MKNRSVPYLVLSILWLVIIFGHSMLSAETSTQESMGLLSVFQIWIPSLSHVVLRKAAHCIEFAVLGFFVTGFFGRKSGMALPMLVCLLAAIIDESIQLFVDGRAGMLQDVWLDFGGMALGVLIMWGALAMLKK